MTANAAVSSAEFQYTGADLEAMSVAENYHRWILDHFRPHLRKSVVEVGAGTGSFARLMAERPLIEKLTLIEPSGQMAALLEDTASELRPVVDVSTYTGFLEGVTQEVAAREPDTFVYVNVLEHIADDVAELRLVYDLLPRGGKICVFVPALMLLYSDFDRSIDHYRRYSKGELVDKAKSVGFSVCTARYFDLPGVLPWFINFKLLKATKMDGAAVAAYDRLAVPVIRLLENAVAPPIGKNVLMVAEKL